LAVAGCGAAGLELADCEAAFFSGVTGGGSDCAMPFAFTAGMEGAATGRGVSARVEAALGCAAVGALGTTFATGGSCFAGGEAPMAGAGALARGAFTSGDCDSLGLDCSKRPSAS
jgi:hypothetical protein